MRWNTLLKIYMEWKYNEFLLGIMQTLSAVIPYNLQSNLMIKNVLVYIFGLVPQHFKNKSHFYDVPPFSFSYSIFSPLVPFEIIFFTSNSLNTPLYGTLKPYYLSRASSIRVPVFGPFRSKRSSSKLISSTLKIIRGVERILLRGNCRNWRNWYCN